MQFGIIDDDSSQTKESRTRSADYSKACSKPKAFNTVALAILNLLLFEAPLRNWRYSKILSSKDG